MRWQIAWLLLAVACGPGRAPIGGHVELKAADAAGPVNALVQRELETAKKENKELLVYVGATWCEPCRRFHDAAKAGKLDVDFPHLRLLEFDADRDRDRLRQAGYTSRLIPLFVRPGPDGNSSGRFIEGSVKGDAAVAEITPRLRSLLVP